MFSTKLIGSAGREDVAVVYVVELGSGKLVECVESIQPPLPRETKWVLLVSTMVGCPIGCMMCDAGGLYSGRLSKDEIFAQIEFLVHRRFPCGVVPSRQFKVQFARMGEPSLNPDVLDVLSELPFRLHAPGLMPSISTVAPKGSEDFFQQLIEIKSEKYSRGRFQLQFSIHTTDPNLRDKLIPVEKWDFSRIAQYGECFYASGDRKIALNFALARQVPVEASTLLQHFNPQIFLVKITPVNPTYRSLENGFLSYIDPHLPEDNYEIVNTIRAAGYQVIVSVGAIEENYIGSNCGQYLRAHLSAKERIRNGYTYSIREHHGAI